ncbi:alpha/beta hydrolase [Reichenbachiella sp.]|uniref:alpha/beta hydrolase n=1 Tax=Reichenbachiella sp. TaxID=2184521 RepID=UPI003B5AD869
MTIRNAFVILCLFVSFYQAASQGSIDAVKIKGTPVDIYVPPSYDNSKEYPVVYFNDGQMLFGHPTITIALQDILDSLIDNRLIVETIVVGVFADELRAERYVPYQNDQFERMPNGDSYAEDYVNFLIDDVVAYVDENYSTVSKPEGRAIFGFSFGGLNALWMLLNRPETFSMAAGISASMWVEDFALYEETKKYKPNQKIWFDIGTAEWNYYVPFQRLLKEQGASINTNAYYFEVKDAVHTWEDVRQRVHMPLMVFAGAKSHIPSKMNVEIEIIPSKSNAQKRFTRLNPVITCKDGLKYSLAYEANYEVTNPSAGKVYEDGRFELYGGENLEVIVTYLDFSKKVKIRSKLLN